MPQVPVHTRRAQLREALSPDIKWDITVKKVLYSGQSKFQAVELIESGPFGKASPCVLPALQDYPGCQLTNVHHRCCCWTARPKAQRQTSMCTTSAWCTLPCCCTPTLGGSLSAEVRLFQCHARLYTSYNAN